MPSVSRRPSVFMVVLLSAALLIPTSASAAAASLVYGDILDVGGAVQAIEVDDASRVAYVSVADSPAIKVIAPESRSIEREIDVSANAAGMSLAADGSLLYVALNGAGSVAEVDTSTGVTLRTFDLNVPLDDPRTYDVQLVGTNDLYVSASPLDFGIAYIVKLDLTTEISQRVADDRIIRATPRFYWDGADQLVVSEGFDPESLVRLDITDPDAPIAAEDDHGAVSGTDEVVFAAGGSRLFTAGGQEIDPQDLQVVGSVPVGRPSTIGGATVFFSQLRNDSLLRIRRYNVTTQKVTGTFNTTCGTGDDSLGFVEMLPGNQVFMVGSSEGLCIVDTTADFPKCAGRAPTIIGTTIGDTLRGTDGHDVILGLGGNDRVVAGRGHDRICGGSGDDEILPGGGNDRVFGGPGNDTINYTDALGPLTIDLGANLVVGSGTEVIRSIENAKGTPGDDTIRGTNGPNRLEGKGGADVIAGLEGADFLDGGRGDDWLVGGSGNDELLGGDGEDLLEPGPGRDFVDGSFNDDYVTYENSASPIVLNLGSSRATGEGFDMLFSIEHALGSEFDDVIRGSNEANQIIGLGGNDEIRGGNGDDQIDGWTGADTIYGGNGNDVLWGHDGHDHLLGGFGDDLLLGERGNDIVNGGLGLDAVSFANATGGVTVNLGDGTSSGEGVDTLISIIDVVGGAGADTIFGNAAGNILIGLEGDDEINALGGNDILDGREGIDVLRAGNGTDECYGGETNISCEAVFDVATDRAVLTTSARPTWR